MTYEWTLFIDLGIIAIALAIATLLRAKVPFFQRFLIPNALTAGFILLAFYNLAAPALGLGTQNLGGLVFHLLNISFISMSLKEGSMKGAGKRIFSTAISVIAHYAIQVAIGLGITVLFIITIKPDLFLNFGFFLALGYGLGPGQSFAIGKAWEGASEGFKGFANAGNIGLIFAAIGYLWGCIGGVWLINFGRKKGWVDADTHAAIGEKSMRTGVFGRNEKGPVGAVLRTDTEAIDSMSFHLLLVFGVYLVAFLVLKLVTWPLAALGSLGKQLSDTLWGISFVFAAIIGMFTKSLMKVLKINHLLDEGTFNRIAGGSVDFMLAAAVGAISLVVVTQYWLPIAVVCIVGGIVTTFTCLWMTSRLFDDHQFARNLMLFGNMTGTLSTGLALLRVVDPEFKTTVASDYVYSNGITFALAIPMILLINLPIRWYATGDRIWLWITIGGFALYLGLSVLAYALLAGKKAFAKVTKAWYTAD
jgi:ESS family glutamate:Na+ symporter